MTIEQAKKDLETWYKTNDPVAKFIGRAVPDFALNALVAGHSTEFVHIRAGAGVDYIGVLTGASSWASDDRYQYLVPPEGGPTEWISRLYDTPLLRFLPTDKASAFCNSVIDFTETALSPLTKAKMAANLTLMTRNTVLPEVYQSGARAAVAAVRNHPNPPAQHPATWIALEPTAQLVALVDSFAKACGVSVLRHRELLVAIGFSDSSDGIVVTHPFQIGAKYMYVEYTIPEGAAMGTALAAAVEAINPALGMGYSRVMLAIPYADDRSATSSKLHIWGNAPAHHSTFTIPDYRYADTQPNTGGTTEVPPLAFIKRGLEVSELSAYLSGITIGQSDALVHGGVANNWKNRFGGATGLLPLVCPPGDMTFFLEGQGSQVVTKEITSLEDVYGSVRTVTVRTVDFTVSRELIALPYNWYETYLTTGYGVYKPLPSAAAVAAALDKVPEYAGNTFCVVNYAIPVALPTNIVDRLTIRQDYKKAKEKACEKDDFYEQPYAGGLTWGQVNEIMKRGINTTAFYGLRGGQMTPAIQVDMTAERESYLPLEMTATVANGVVTSLNAGSISLMNDPEGFYARISLGGSLSGATHAQVDALYGPGAAGQAAEQASLVELYTGGKTIDQRQQGGAPGDFAWETLSINGYPLYKEMPEQSAYKMAIASVVFNTAPGSRLMTAVRSFSLSRVNSRLGY